MKSAIRYLADGVPAWFSLDAIGGKALTGRARVPKTPWVLSGVQLRIFGHPKPKVCEEIPGTDMPARCPERHIQFDKTFCLGLRYLDVRSIGEAKQWWEQLRQFLLCQGVAERTGVWPPGHALDHGDAGKHHERALALAADAGLDEEYAAARLGEPSWLTNPQIHMFDKMGKPINGRAVCPRGCQRTARGRSVQVLRRDCSKRIPLVDLAFTEKLRCNALAKYWKGVFKEESRCCRKMRLCGLGQHEDSLKTQGEKNS